MAGYLNEKELIKSHLYSDGTSYKGSTMNGLRHGYGKQTFVDGSVYIGQFRNGLADGYGKLSFVNGSQYCGSFARGKFCGVGQFKLPNKDIIHGEFFNGKVEGRGAYERAMQQITIAGLFSQGKLIQHEDCEGLLDEVATSVQTVQAYVEECKLALST